MPQVGLGCVEGWWISVSICSMPRGQGESREQLPGAMVVSVRQTVPLDLTVDFPAGDTWGKSRANGLRLLSGEAENVPLPFAARSAHNGAT